MSPTLLAAFLLACISCSQAELQNTGHPEVKSIPLPLLLRILYSPQNQEERRIQVDPNDHVVISNEHQYMQQPNGNADGDFNLFLLPHGGNPLSGYWSSQPQLARNAQTAPVTSTAHNNAKPLDYTVNKQGLYPKKWSRNDEGSETQKMLVRHKRWGTRPCFGSYCGGVGGGGIGSSSASSSSSASAMSFSSSPGGNILRPYGGSCQYGNCGGYGGGCLSGNCGGYGGQFGGCPSGNCGGYGGQFGGCRYGNCRGLYSGGGCNSAQGCWRKRK